VRYLNRIIFINSAHIKYAEINLDGNIHFIGTQGVGKSTTLRAILFFYNADTLKLGIAKEKKSFTEYYFAFAGSYIIYEVARPEGKYCVLAYKSQNRICFRIFDGPYEREYFIRTDGKVYESWDRIVPQLDEKSIFYTRRKIDNYQEYRDILYGNNDGKKSEFKRFALLESREYQNIPRTIQNVFLNSKVESEFIKETIIMSLENDIQIDLSTYTHHLKDFDVQLEDIRIFRHTRTTAQANAIAQLYTLIKQLTREKLELAQQLAWAWQALQENEPHLKIDLEKQQSKETNGKNNFKKLWENFQTEQTKSNKEINSYEDKLQTAKKKAEYYGRMNITQLIQQASQRPALEAENQSLFDEKSLLTAQFIEVIHKYEALLKELENQLQSFENNQNKEKIRLQSDFLQFKDTTKDSYVTLIASINATHKKEIEAAQQNYQEKLQAVQDLKIKKAGLLHQRFFESEIKAAQHESEHQADTISKANIELKEYTNAIETFTKQLEADEKFLQNTHENSKEKINLRLVAIFDRITEIDSYIQNGKYSFYGWLSENYPGWENTIGKVIDEKNILFNSDLEPKLIDNSSKSFYGVEIDLEEINKPVKTISDYENDKATSQEQAAGLQKDIDALIVTFTEEKEKLKRKYLLKIREKREAIQENNYLIEQATTKLNKAILKQEDLKNQAQVEQKRAIEVVNMAIALAAEEQNLAKQQVINVVNEVDNLIKTKEVERETKIKVEEQLLRDYLSKIDNEIRIKKQNKQSREKEIEAQKQKELSSKAVDTKRLDEIDKRLKVIKSTLDNIEKNNTVITRYNYDKEEYFDKVDAFQYQKDLLNNQFTQEQEKYQQEQNTLNKEMSIIQAAIRVLLEEVQHYQEDKENFEIFKSSELYETLQEYLVRASETHKTNKRVKVLIDDLKQIHYDKLIKSTENLRKTIVEFLGRFSEDNIFKFNKIFIDTDAYLNFAAELADFMAEDKIAVIEKEVNENFAYIIKTIGKDTTDLVSKEGEIQGIITKINRDFLERNFAGVIKKIELRLDESKNEVVQLLKLIKEFNDENSYSIGPANLFSAQDQDSTNKKAIDLLKQFVKKIADLKRDYISLSDSFELKFRIEENLNDTGWVERLSNVGSDGTDILVKAMINIMLLNVFKDHASKRFKDFKLHCMMDEIGKLHPNNVRGILKFANDRNINLINSSPTENDALAFKHIYKLEKDDKSITRVKRILSQHAIA